MPEELITLLSLDDARKANELKSKLENVGIRCYFNGKVKKSAAKLKTPVDLKVSLNDLDRALKVIEHHDEENQGTVSS